jgi:predicted kinase
MNLGLQFIDIILIIIGLSGAGNSNWIDDVCLCQFIINLKYIDRNVMSNL